MKKRKRGVRRKQAAKDPRKKLQPGHPGEPSVAPSGASSCKQTLGLAADALQSGRPQEAARLCKQVLQQNPRATEALNLAGVAAYQTGDASEAISLLKSAVALRPDFADAHYHLGNILEADHCFIEAEASYRRCIALDAESAPAHYHLGNVLKALGRLDDAHAAYERALRIAPSHVEALSNAGIVNLELGRTADAIDAFRKAIDVNPSFAKGHYNLGLALQDAGDSSAAIASFECALNNDPGHLGAQNNIGHTYKQMGRLDDAARAFAKAIRMAPDYDKVRINLGDLYLRQGKPQAAIQVCDDYLASHPGNTPVLAFKAIALEENGDTDAVRELYDFDRMLRPVQPSCPDGFADMAQFNRALVEHVLNHPSLAASPASHATRSGRHTGELLAEPKGPVAELEGMIMAAVDDYCRALVHDPAHPWLVRRPQRLALAVWGVAMDRQGHQLAHIHPSAWLSGVYYPKIPAAICAEDPGHAGWIEFGRAPEEFHALMEPEVRLIRPEEGLMVLFPSYFYHGTVPLESDEVRISIAFDVIERV